MLAEKIAPCFLRYNYIGLKLVIVNDIDPDDMVSALTTYFPCGEQEELGSRRRYTPYEIQAMQRLREEGFTYREIADSFDLKCGDNVYQILKRVGLVPRKGSPGRPRKER